MRKALTLAIVFSFSLVFCSFLWARSGPPVPNAIWADGILFGTVPTPNSLPPHGPKDGLYNFTNLTGQRAVAESKPGDRDYNGGRWQVTLLEYTQSGLAFFDPDGDGVANSEMTSWEMVQDHINMGHLAVVGPGPSFSCPMIPQH
jgi:hypothetical protein